MRNLIYNERGVTLAELMAVLAIVIVLLTIAIPTFLGNANQARDTQAKSDVRQALIPVKTVNLEAPNAADYVDRVLDLAPDTAVDVDALTGVKIEKATDGATCVWKVSQSGAVFGAWESFDPIATPTLFVERADLPAACPDAAGAPGVGFVSTPW